MQWEQWCLPGIERPTENVRYCKKCGPLPSANFYSKASICKACWLENDRTNPVRKKAIQGYRKKWADENPDTVRHLCQKRRVTLKNATVWWADQEAIRNVFTQAHEQTDDDGNVFAVDHQVPLTGRPLLYTDSAQVCGLHVDYNLTPLARSLNSTKSNKLLPEQAVSITPTLQDKTFNVYVAKRSGKGFYVATYANGEVITTYEIT